MCSILLIKRTARNFSLLLRQFQLSPDVSVRPPSARDLQRDARLLLNTVSSFQDSISSHESKTGFHVEVLKMNREVRQDGATFNLRNDLGSRYFEHLWCEN